MSPDVRAAAGDRVAVRAARVAGCSGSALYSDRSQIALRMLTYGDAAGRRCAHCGGASSRRSRFRAVAGDRRDGLPPRSRRSRSAAVADRRSLRRLPRACRRCRRAWIGCMPLVVSMLEELAAPKGILARNDPRTRAARRSRAAGRGARRGRARDGRRRRRTASTYDVDLRHGQKTGLFLDQRENREAAARVRPRPAARLLQLPRRLRARRWRGRCTRDDRDRHLGGRRRAASARTPRATASRSTRASATCSTSLRGLERLGERFDTIVLDPPAFAKSKAAVAEGDAGYKEINLRALKLLNPGGTLVTCSCSYNVSEAAFAEIVYERRGRRAGARHGRREADAGPRSSGAARRAGNLLPEVLHPAKAGVSAPAAVGARGRARSSPRSRARPAASTPAATSAAAAISRFYNVGTSRDAAHGARRSSARIAARWSVDDALAFADIADHDRVFSK